MAKTLKVISDRSDRPDDLVAAGELLDLRFGGGAKTLTLRAAKLLHLLVDAAGADACEDRVHSVPIEHLNQTFHISRDDFIETCRELFGTTVQMEIQTKRGPATKVGPLLADVERDLEEGDGSEVRFQLSPILRLVLARSNHWGILSRRAVLAFESRYALRLYEIISLHKSKTFQSSVTLSITELREAFGVPHGKLERWVHLRQKVLDMAVAEVNQLSGLTVTYDPIKRGRSVVSVHIEWSERDAAGRVAVARELEASRVGRKARRDGTVETLVDPDEQAMVIPSFPRSGALSYSRWREIARDNLPVPTPDIEHVANRFRAWCEAKKIPLSHPKIEQTWAGFCRSWGERNTSWAE